MEQALNPTDWYMKLLAPLSTDIKLDLIGRLFIPPSMLCLQSEFSTHA